MAVSYTHLDVYKRQIYARSLMHIWMSLQMATELAQLAEFFNGEEIEQSQRCIKSRRSMPFAEHKAVTVWFMRVLGEMCIRDRPKGVV